MISDNELYRLALFLGSCSMLMVVLYHFLEVNARDDEADKEAPTGPAKTIANTEAMAPGPSPTAVGASAIGGGKGR